MTVLKEDNILIIGYGNQTRQDDSLGPYVAEALEKKLPNIDIEITQEIGPEFCEELINYGLVIFIDAGVEQEEELIIRELSSHFRSTPFSHHMHPETLLAITERLYNRCPKAYLVSIKGYSFDFGFEISSKAKTSAERAIEEVERICMNWQSQKK
ncbi:MAG: hydrogenase maturation protease [bacterium]